MLPWGKMLKPEVVCPLADVAGAHVDYLDPTLNTIVTEAGDHGVAG